jgi:hypothetical protein
MWRIDGIGDAPAPVNLLQLPALVHAKGVGRVTAIQTKDGPRRLRLSKSGGGQGREENHRQDGSEPNAGCWKGFQIEAVHRAILHSQPMLPPVQWQSKQENGGLVGSPPLCRNSVASDLSQDADARIDSRVG